MSTTEQPVEEHFFKQLGERLSNWSRWGPDDQLGTLNFITDEARRDAAGLIRSGRTFDLSMTFDSEGPQKHGLTAGRFDPIHLMITLPTESTRPAGIAFADDAIMMPLQCASQWDSLAHAGYLYNGVPMTEVTATDGALRNSIDKVVASLVGRGVLLDIARLRGVDCLEAGSAIMPDELAAAAAAQGVSIRSGDIVLIRSGWYQHVHAGDHATYMQAEVPGLDVSCCEWLHENEIAAVGSDTYCVERKPSGQPGVTHPVHMVLIRDLGMTLGEMFDFEELAADCAADGNWDFFFTGIPLKLARCVGSPVSPVAIR
jgi:kynurenine formamidase